MTEVPDVIGGQESEGHRCTRADRAGRAALAVGNPLDHPREVTVIGGPQRDEIVPGSVLIPCTATQ
jgi:hypothetical protein